MSNTYYIGDDEIRVAGKNRHKIKKNKSLFRWIITAVGIIIVTVVVFAIVRGHRHDSELSIAVEIQHDSVIWFDNSNDTYCSCTDVIDTVVDSLHLKILIPYNSVPELHVGRLDTTEVDIIFATLAADVRRDNGKIVGAFVKNGEPLSWGLSKRGYCAISDKGISVGVAENSPLFEQATEEGGSFFRQYPAVDNGVMVENNPENLSFRRALCTLDEKVCIIVCNDRVLMNDFSNTLVKLGVQDAIFLVGGTADGWYRTGDGTMCRLGKKTVKGNGFINYLVFRAQ